MYPLRSITGFFPPLNDKVVRIVVQMRTEQTVGEASGTGGLATGTDDGTAASGFEETAISGQTWSFCVAEAT